MKQGQLTHASEAPFEIEIRNLYSDVYELVRSEERRVGKECM